MFGKSPEDPIKKLQLLEIEVEDELSRLEEKVAFNRLFHVVSALEDIKKQLEAATHHHVATEGPYRGYSWIFGPSTQGLYFQVVPENRASRLITHQQLLAAGVKPNPGLTRIKC